MFFEISERAKELSSVALKKAEAVFGRIDELTEYNQQKVLSAFIRNRIDETDFNTTTGYGYSDKGREKLDVLTADIFGAESAIIRAGALASGTHTLAVCLYGVLRPGDLGGLFLFLGDQHPDLFATEEDIVRPGCHREASVLQVRGDIALLLEPGGHGPDLGASCGLQEAVGG